MFHSFQWVVMCQSCVCIFVNIAFSSVQLEGSNNKNKKLQRSVSAETATSTKTTTRTKDGVDRNDRANSANSEKRKSSSPRPHSSAERRRPTEVFVQVEMLQPKDVFVSCTDNDRLSNLTALFEITKKNFLYERFDISGHRVFSGSPNGQLRRGIRHSGEDVCQFGKISFTNGTLRVKM